MGGGFDLLLFSLCSPSTALLPQKSIILLNSLITIISHNGWLLSYAFNTTRIYLNKNIFLQIYQPYAFCNFNWLVHIGKRKKILKYNINLSILTQKITSTQLSVCFVLKVQARHGFLYFTRDNY